MIRVFISYRHDDVAAIAHDVYRYLCDVLDEGFVVIDTVYQSHNIQTLPDLVSQVRKSDVLLVIIGKQWQRILNEREKLLEEGAIDEDWVREEIHHGLVTDGVFVVPVQIDDAAMPAASTLPSAIISLAHKPATPIRRTAGQQWDKDQVFSASMEALLARIINRSNYRFCGVTEIHRTFPVRTFGTRVAKAKKTVRLLSAWTSKWDDLSPDFEKAIKQGVEVHFLLLDRSYAVEKGELN